MTVAGWRLVALLSTLLLCACAAPATPAALTVTFTSLPPSETNVASASDQASSTPPGPISTAPASSTAQPAPNTPTVAGPASTPAAVAPNPLHQLTTGGCCVQPFWSADGSQVRYIDRPSSGQPSGIWAVGLSGGAPILVTTRLGIYSPDEKLVAYLEGGQTYIERVGGDRFRVDNGGRAVVFSPESTRIAWQAESSLFNLDRRHDQIWVAAVDGTSARQAAALTGGALAGWFPDGQHLLVTSHDGDNSLIQSLAVADGSLTLIATVPRLQGLALSPQGGWLAYAVAFSGDPNLDGLWVVKPNGGGARRLDTFGAFAWRAEGRLLVIPLDAASTSAHLLEVDTASGEARALTDPAVTPFQIAQGNWALSPDGSRLAFVSAADHNIWVLDLME